MMSNLPFSMKDRVHVHVHASSCCTCLGQKYMGRDCSEPLLFFCGITFLN